MIPEAETLASPVNIPTIVDKLPALPIDDAPDEWHAWREDKLYDIESIVSAEPSGRGWKLRVKWEGHPTLTTERLSIHREPGDRPAHTGGDRPPQGGVPEPVCHCAAAT